MAQPPPAELRARLKNFRQLLRQRKLSAALISDERNVRYLSGFTGDDSALLITQRHKVLLTDFRYVEEARKSARGWKVVIEKIKPPPKGAPKKAKPTIIIPPGLMEKAGFIAKKLRARRLAFEPRDLRVVDLRALRRAARPVKCRAEENLVGELRIIKSPWEIRQIEKALRIQERCFLRLCRGMKNGLTERQAAAWLRYLMVTSGADDEAFHSMFQIRSNSSLPHGRPTDRALNGSANILLDFGAKYGGYHSDLTRSFFIGRIPRRIQKIHQVVLEAQAAAIARIAPDVEFKDVDTAAREVITKAGYGKQFGHSTGHGLGLNIHEAPSLSQRAKGKLRAGMVVTVEPGVYLPGVGGVRIEDDVLVTPTGRRMLSRLPKGLRWNGGNK